MNPPLPDNPTPSNPVGLAKRQLRFMVISTGLLAVPQLDRIWHSTVIFEFIGLFSVPTGLILTAAITWSVRRRWQDHGLLIAVAALNLILVLALVPLMLR